MWRGGVLYCTVEGLPRRGSIVRNVGSFGHKFLNRETVPCSQSSLAGLHCQDEGAHSDGCVCMCVYVGGS